MLDGLAHWSAARMLEAGALLGGLEGLALIAWTK